MQLIFSVDGLELNKTWPKSRDLILIDQLSIQSYSYSNSNLVKSDKDYWFQPTTSPQLHFQMTQEG